MASSKDRDITHLQQSEGGMLQGLRQLLPLAS